ncbi:MAG: cysteine desulfurase NifS [Saccharofermentanales bacterium]
MNEIKRVYLDNAATTPIRAEVLEAMMPYFTSDFGNPSSLYESGRTAKKALELSREIIANSIKANPSEIFFTSCGSESDNWAIKGVVQAYASKGRHIITSAIEHHAVLHVCQTLEKNGYEVTYIGVDSEGIVNAEDVRAAIRPDTVLVTIMMANNEIGTIQPIAEIAAICNEKGVVFHTDAVQALGALHIDVNTLGAGLISFSGHKVNAPKGIGVLYVRKGIKIAPFIEGGAQERRKRAGTENIPYIAGFAKAVQLAEQECDMYYPKLLEIRNTFIDGVLSRIPHVRLNGHRDLRLPGNANLSFEFIEGESLLLMLDSMGFECSSGSACTSGSLDPSHVLLAIGLPHEIAHGSLRVTFGKFNNIDEVEPLIQALEKIVSRLRDMSPLYEDFVKGKTTEPHCMFTDNSSCSKFTTGCYKNPANKTEE